MDDVISLTQDSDITELKTKYVHLSKMYEDTQKNSKMLEDELQSTKQKLKVTESQLSRSPKWSPSQKHESELQFLKARHQAEIDSLNTKIFEKDQEIEDLKRKCCTNNPDITSFITFATKSIQLAIEKGLTNDHKDLISQFEITLHDFQSFLTQASSLQRFFQTMKSLIKVLVDTNVILNTQKQERETSQIFTLQKKLSSLKTDQESKTSEIEELKQTNQKLLISVSQLRDQLSITTAELDSYKNQTNLQTTTLNELLQKLKIFSSPSKFQISNDFFDIYKKVDSSVSRLLRIKEENDTYKSVFTDFIEKSLGIKTAAFSDKVFEKVTEKMNNQALALIEISKIFSVNYTTNEQLIRDVKEIKNSLNLTKNKTEKENDQLARVVRDYSEQISDLQSKIAKIESDSKDLQLKNENLTNQNNLLIHQREISLQKDEKQQNDFQEKEKNYQKQIENLNSVISKSKSDIKKNQIQIKELNDTIETQTSKNEQCNQIINNLSDDNKKLTKQIQDFIIKNNQQMDTLTQNKITIETQNKEIEVLKVFKDESEKVTEENNELKSQLESVEKENKNIKTQNMKYKNLLDQFTNKVKSNKTQINDLSNENKSLKNKLDTTTNDLNTMSINYQSILQNITETTKELNFLKEENTNLKQNLFNLTNKNKNHEDLLENLKNQVEIASSTIAKLNTEKEHLLLQLNSSQSNEKNISSNLQNLQKEIEITKSLNNELNERISSMTNEMLKLHESDAQGQIAIEELKTTKENNKKLSDQIQNKNDEISKLNADLLNIKSEISKLSDIINKITNENQQLKDDIEQRDVFISNLQDKKKENNLMEKKLNEATLQLEETKERLRKVTHQFDEMSKVRNKEIQDSQTMIAKLTKLLDKRQNKLSQLKQLLKQTINENNKLQNHIQIIEKDNQNNFDMIQKLQNSTVSSSDYEDVKQRLMQTQSELNKKEKDILSKEREISKTSKQSRIVENQLKNLENCKTIVGRINSICLSSSKLSLDSVVNELQPLFELFSYPSVYKLNTKLNLSLISRQIFSNYSESGELFTKQHRQILQQVMNKLLQFPTNSAFPHNGETLSDKLNSMNLIVDEVRQQFDAMEKNQNRLDAIVSSQHSAIVKMNQYMKSPLPSPMKN